MRFALFLYAALVVAGASAFEITSGGVTFAVPEKGEGLRLVENGKSERVFFTNFSISDNQARRRMVVDEGASNVITRLAALPGRSIWRVTYPLRNADALQYSVVYRFYEGVPGVTVTEEMLALKPLRVHAWNMTGIHGFTALSLDGQAWRDFPTKAAFKDFHPALKEMKKGLLARAADQRVFYYDRGFTRLEGDFFYSPYRKRLSAMEGTLLEAGERLTKTHTVGRVLKNGDVAALVSLPGRTLFDGREGPIVVTRLEGAAGEKGPDWKSLPILAQRGESRDYRPHASNQWKGSQDLSFALKAAYDDRFLYLHIDVTDDQIHNGYRGRNLWLGDALQFGIDPLQEKYLGKNHIDLLVAAAGEGARAWTVTHSVPTFVGEGAKAIRNRSYVRKGGIVYDLAFPWAYLAPFKPADGCFGMSFAATDQDAGSSCETWMGLTDGILGGHDAGLYAKFVLEGKVDLASGELPAGGGRVLKREDMLALFDCVTAIHRKFDAKVKQLAAANRRDDYLAAVAEMARHFLKFEREDLDAKKVLRAFKEVEVTKELRAYIYGRFETNLTYLEKLLPTLITRADETLLGKHKPEQFVRYDRGVRPQIVDGGFSVNGKELLLFGPNTWVSAKGWEVDRPYQIETIARTGFNMFNLFNLTEPTRTEIMKLAERENIYCSFGSLTDEELTLNEAAWRDFWRKVDEKPIGQGGPREKFGYVTPNLIFQCAHPEGFGRSHEKTDVWAANFRAHLLKKFGSLSGINAALSLSFNTLDEIDFAQAVANPALKYASMEYRLDQYLPRERAHLKFKRDRFANLPISGHFSTHWNLAGLDPLLVLADFERIWDMYEVIGYDGGCSLGGSEFLIDFASGCFEVDFARSLYPGKPLSNNENHVIPDGVFDQFSDEKSYLAAALPFFLGQNSSSMWVWCPRYHWDGDYAFTMANTYHAALKMVCELRRVPEEIASFRRTLEPPFRFLHSVPSMTDRDTYIRSLYSVYSGVSFSGWAVRFATERKLAAGDLGRCRLIVVPDARRVSNATFAALVRFARHGGRVVVVGEKALLADEYGKPVPARRPLCASLFRRVTSISTREYAQVLEDELAKLGEKPPIAVRDMSGNAPFGVLTRTGKTADGRATLLVVNLLKKATAVTIPGTWKDALSGKVVSGRTELALGEVLVLSK